MDREEVEIMACDSCDGVDFHVLIDEEDGMIMGVLCKNCEEIYSME